MTDPSTFSIAAAVALPLVVLAPLALAGVALINTGLGRSRSAAQSLFGCIAILALAALCFALVGAGFAGGSGHGAVWIGGRQWDWIGTGPWFGHALDSGACELRFGFVLELLGAGMCGLIPWGGGADRWRLTGGCAAAAVLSLFTFPLAAHWIWGGGWLAKLSTSFGASAAIADPGGATIHLLGGFTALAVIWIAGPRRGKFPKEGLATAIPGHNTIYVLFGCLLALAGWLAWNCAGALLWMDSPLDALPRTVANTFLLAAAAFLGTLAMTRIRFGKPDASLCANGWLAGLVTSSGCALLISPLEAAFAGAVIGIATPLLVEALELMLSIDDPTGAITVHGAGGLWGLLVTGLFAQHSGQMLAQAVGIAAIAGFLFPLSYLLLALLDRAVPFRVDPDGERLGMDLHELGGGAYPEFVIHRDESYR